MAGSFNGRMARFERADGGSIPSPVATWVKCYGSTASSNLARRGSIPLAHANNSGCSSVW